jgi:hypothetical protein
MFGRINSKKMGGWYESTNGNIEWVNQWEYIAIYNIMYYCTIYN